MKHILVLSLFLFAISAHAETREVSLLCFQNQVDEGWIEVGIIPSDIGGGWELLVVPHEGDEDDQGENETITLLKTAKVELQSCEGKDCYKDASDTMKLVSTNGQFNRASIFTIDSNPDVRLAVTDLECFVGDDTITYNRTLVGGPSVAE